VNSVGVGEQAVSAPGSSQHSLELQPSSQGRTRACHVENPCWGPLVLSRVQLLPSTGALEPSRHMGKGSIMPGDDWSLFISTAEAKAWNVNLVIAGRSICCHLLQCSCFNLAKGQ
jgi:hypothetical protein